MDILARIDELRNQRAWSVHKLAKEAGLQQSTLNNLYERNNAPTFPTLEKICAAFGISFAEFFSEYKEITLSGEQKDILDKWEFLSAEQKKGLLPILFKKM